MTHERHDVLGPELRNRVSAIVDRHLDEDEAGEHAARVVWSCLAEPGDGVAGRLVAARGAVAALADVTARTPADRIAAATGIEPRDWRSALERWRPRLVPAAVRAAVDAAAVGGVRLLLPDDPRWPAMLGDLGDNTPLCLWVRGDPGALARADPAVAIVGARAATSYGEHMAVELSAELSSRGVAVVSGAAYGIDGAAHRAALSSGGLTIALLAGGADRPYPAGNAALIDRIAASGGAVVSEVPCGAAPTKWRFLQRNRVIAALSQATVVVEAGWRSGSLNTANHAAQLGRALGAVPGPVTSAASAGCHRVLRELDSRCITSAGDVMELLGVPASTRAGDDGAARTDDRTRVLDALSLRARRTPDDVARRAGMSRADVEGLLGLLSLEGAAVGGDGGWRRTPVP